MAKRVRVTSGFFLKTGPGTKVSGTFGAWGRLAKSNRRKYTYVIHHSRGLGNPNPKNRFSSTNQPPRP